jgi:hypothetical protein
MVRRAQPFGLSKAPHFVLRAGDGPIYACCNGTESERCVPQANGSVLWNATDPDAASLPLPPRNPALVAPQLIHGRTT